MNNRCEGNCVSRRAVLLAAGATSLIALTASEAEAKIVFTIDHTPAKKEEEEAAEKAGETEVQAARGKRAEFWARVGDKVLTWM